MPAVIFYIKFPAAIAGCAAALAVGLVATGMCYYRMRRSSKAAAEAAYPAYGVTGENYFCKQLSTPPGYLYAGSTLFPHLN